MEVHQRVGTSAADAWSQSCLNVFTDRILYAVESALPTHNTMAHKLGVVVRNAKVSACIVMKPGYRWPRANTVLLIKTNHPYNWCTLQSEGHLSPRM